jgi:hypothetical protein
MSESRPVAPSQELVESGDSKVTPRQPFVAPVVEELGGLTLLTQVVVSGNL